MGSEILRLPVQPEDRLAPTIELPAPTAWPIVLAFGFTLVFAGLVTSSSVSILGAILAVAGCVGWFREVSPHEKHESVTVAEKVPVVATSRPQVARVAWMTQELHRARLPLEIYPISAGIKGGLAGSVAMAVLAVIYGIVSGHGMWYPINLLSAGFFPARTTIEQIAAFHWDALIIATIVHLLCSVLVGLLYGVALPMFPRDPILLGGAIAPVLWSGLLHSVLEAINPVLEARIFSLSPLQDQECAGALMWVCVTFAYLIPAVVITMQILSPGVAHREAQGALYEFPEAELSGPEAEVI